MHLVSYYAHALYVSMQGNKMEDAVALLTRLKEVLKKRGHQMLFQKVLKETLKLHREAEGKATPVLTVAKKEDADSYGATLALYGIVATNLDVQEDNAIIGGFVYSDTHRIIDGSFKHSLHQLYNRLIA
jgi:F0F1-type ATP synthase delta subunit